ncbi:MAG TPA: hypothetical protein VN841_24095 [Bryobacteraceae bacterium]|nr:hypothetical protein [Bryobacteraceae bacterium]
MLKRIRPTKLGIQLLEKACAPITWMHSGGFFEWLSDAMLLAQAGAVSGL